MPKTGNPKAAAKVKKDRKTVILSEEEKQAKNKKRNTLIGRILRFTVLTAIVAAIIFALTLPLNVGYNAKYIDGNGATVTEQADFSGLDYIFAAADVLFDFDESIYQSLAKLNVDGVYNKYVIDTFELNVVADFHVLVLIYLLPFIVLTIVLLLLANYIVMSVKIFKSKLKKSFSILHIVQFLAALVVLAAAMIFQSVYCYNGVLEISKGYIIFGIAVAAAFIYPILLGYSKKKINNNN
ncbi:MAG: hypothetical protein LBT30_02565 [Clostridiales bacterium]|nr:hypothetical protein [Clostridiales bacterium]